MNKDICIIGEANSGKTTTLLRAAASSSLKNKIYVHSTELEVHILGERLHEMSATMENVISGHHDIFDFDEFVKFIEMAKVSEIYLDMPLLNLKWEERMTVAQRVKEMSERTGLPIFWTQQVSRQA